MPNFNDNELTILTQLAAQQQGDNAATSPGHLLVQAMANDQVNAQGDAGGGNFSADAVRKLNGAGHNYDDTLTLEQNLAKLHPSKSKPEDLERLNGQLENTVVVDSHISGGGGNFWTARW